MNLRFIFAVLIISSFSNYVWAGPCNAPTVKLQNNKWAQVSLPCDPRNNNLAKIFGGNIETALGPPGKLGEDWAVWEYAEEGYKELTADSKMVQGTGYWIIQATGQDLDFSMPSGSTSTKFTGGIPLSFFSEISLNTTADAHRWNMAGNPFVVPVADISVNYEGVKECTGLNISATCSLVDSEKLGIVHKTLYHYDHDEQTYKPIGAGSFNSLRAWDGFWVATLGKAKGEFPGLIIGMRRGIN